MISKHLEFLILLPCSAEHLTSELSTKQVLQYLVARKCLIYRLIKYRWLLSLTYRLVITSDLFYM